MSFIKVFYSLICREFKLFFQNKVLRILFFGAPILYGILIGSVYQKGKVTHLPIVVVDEDASLMSTKLIDMLEQNESIYIAKLLPSLYDSKDEATRYDATTVVYIPKGFGQQIQQNQLPELTLFVNSANTLTSNTAMMAVNIVASTFKAGIQIESLKKRGTPLKIAEQQYEPFKTTIIRQNIRSGNYLYFMLPGVLLTVFQQVLLLGLALSFASEFENGTFGSLVQKMPNAFGLFAVKVIPYVLMSAVIMLMYWLFGIYYHMPLEASLFPFLLSTIVFVMAVCSIGILCSVLIPSQLKATEVLMVVATPSFILSGFTWPLSQMPDWIQAISNVIPLTHYLQIFRLLFIEKANVAFINSPLQALSLIALICTTLSLVVLYIKIKKQQKHA